MSTTPAPNGPVTGLPPTTTVPTELLLRLIDAVRWNEAHWSATRPGGARGAALPEPAGAGPGAPQNPALLPRPPGAGARPGITGRS